MVFNSPNLKEVYQAEVMETSLSLALWLKDDFTQKKAIGPIDVFIKEGALKAIQNPSGYYIFTQNTLANYTVAIESDLYFPVEHVEKDLDEPNDRNPVIIVMKPLPSYPFPADATLIRGMIHGPGGCNAIIEATVKLLKETKTELSNEDVSAGDSSFSINRMNESPINVDDRLVLKTRTTEKGEFVIYFRSIKASTFWIRLKISHPNYKTFEQDVEVNEGKITSLNIPLEIK